MVSFMPIIVPHSHSNEHSDYDGQQNTQGNFCSCGEARVAGEGRVAQVATRFLGCKCASLQAREEQIRSVIRICITVSVSIGTL